MPYEFDYKHHTLPKELDRRIKLSDTDKEEINILIKQGAHLKHHSFVGFTKEEIDLMIELSIL